LFGPYAWTKTEATLKTDYLRGLSLQCLFWAPCGREMLLSSCGS